MVESDGDRPRDLPGKIVAALDRIARGIRAHRQQVATEVGISPLQAELLRVIGEGVPPPATPGALAIELGVRQPTVSDSLRFLEAKGMLRRDPDPGDGRRTVVTLTVHGRAVFDRLGEADGVLRETVASLPDADRERTHLVLLEVIERMLRAGIIDVARTCTTCSFFQPGAPTPHCGLLRIPLPPPALRINCPEYERAS